MTIHLSDIAASRVQHYLQNRGKGIGLRLGVKTTGCSGLAYVIEFVDELRDDDEVFESNGVKVVVDKKSPVFLDGTEVDYAKVGLQEGFQFKNPNAKDACGCGESFTV
jgi:iron-sulfur cluster assembly protein